MMNLNDLKDKKFILTDIPVKDILSLFAGLCSNKYKLYAMDCREMNTLDGFHNVLSSTFSFAKYYGRNVDAAIDCLEDLDYENIEGFLVIFKNANNLLVDTSFVVTRWDGSRVKKKQNIADMAVSIFSSSSGDWAEDLRNDPIEANRRPARHMLTIFQDENLNFDKFKEFIKTENANYIELR